MCFLFTSLVSALDASVSPLLSHKLFTFTQKIHSMEHMEYQPGLLTWSSVTSCQPPLSEWFFLCRSFLTLHSFSQAGRQSPGDRLSLQNFLLQRAEDPSINPGDGSEEWSRLPHRPIFQEKEEGNFAKVR